MGHRETHFTPVCVPQPTEAQKAHDEGRDYPTDRSNKQRAKLGRSDQETHDNQQTKAGRARWRGNTKCPNEHCGGL